MEKPDSGAGGGNLGDKSKVGKWTVAFWAALFFAGLVFTLLLKREHDLPVYLRAGERLARGEPIHRMDETEVRAFTYPALFALPFVPLTWLPGVAQVAVWYTLIFASLAVVGTRLKRRLQPHLIAAPGVRAPSVWVFWVLVVVLAGRHILSNLEHLSHDPLLFLCTFLAIDALCAERSKTAGLLAGLGAALKATPLLFAPVLLWQRRFAAVVCLVLALLVGVFLPDVLYSSADGNFWIVNWHRAFLTSIQPGESASSSVWMPWWELNQSVAGTVHRLFASPDPINGAAPDVSLVVLGPFALRAMTLGCQLAVAAWLFWLTRPALTRHLQGTQLAFARLGQGAVLLTAMALLSPTSIKQHFCVLLVPIAFCLADFLYRRRDPLVGTALALAFVFGTLTAKGLIPKALADRALAAGSVTWCALALYAATGRVLMLRARLARETSQVPKDGSSLELEGQQRAA